jgi:hypothetical protein
MCYCRACAAWLATLAVQYIIEGCERRGQVGKLGVSDTLMMVQKLVAEGKVRISEHGYDELADDNIFAIEVLDGVHAAETAMIRKAKFIHEGRYAAEIPVGLIEDDTGWSPYLSVGDAAKLDTVRNALRTGDVAAASRYGRVFELVPVTE